MFQELDVAVNTVTVELALHMAVDLVVFHFSLIKKVRQYFDADGRGCGRK